LAQAERLADSRTRCTAGVKSAIKIATIAMTTSNSIKVKAEGPRRGARLVAAFTCRPPQGIPAGDAPLQRMRHIAHLFIGPTATESLIFFGRLAVGPHSGPMGRSPRAITRPNGSKRRKWEQSACRRIGSLNGAD